MTSRMKCFGFPLAIFLMIAALSACGPIAEDRECGEMRAIGLSEAKTKIIRRWIEDTLGDPSGLAKSGRESGPFLARNFDTGLDWIGLGIIPDHMVIEFEGKSVDYKNLDRSAVDAVIIGRGYGYKLIFKLDPRSNIEARLIEASKKPYGAIMLEALGPDLLLVCQVNRFG